MSGPPDFFAVYSLVHRPLINQVNEILYRHKLSSSYWRVLRILEKSARSNFGDITDALYVEKPALTKIVKKLVELGYVIVERGVDKREKVIALTELGRAQITKIRSELNPFLEGALDGLTAEQLENAIDVLHVIRKNITNK